MKLRMLLVAAVAAISLPARAGDALQGQMRAFDFLLGTWEGEGWIQFGPQRRNFRQHETVRTAAGGVVVVVDGLGVGADADNQGKKVHEAFAVAHWDAAANQFRWIAFRAADGTRIEATPVLQENQLIWEPPAIGGRKARFTIRREPDGRWHEIGEAETPDGKRVPFLEMWLKRVGDAP
jgi:hypothetical protein